MDTLLAVSPIDGRYHNATAKLTAYFSEFALIRYRLHVEVEYFVSLAEKKFFMLSAQDKKDLRRLITDFSLEDAQSIKNTEKITNHDVKAVEYFLKEKLSAAGLGHVSEWVHFGLTSQDVNNTAMPLAWKGAVESLYLPSLLNLQQHIIRKAKEYENIPMLARTHGQPASPTRLGTEWMVFAERLENQVQLFSYIPFMGKFGGATGNFNAHVVAYPKY
ncbi:MAG: lyase family protein, partial [Ferruginibacter sp.]